MSLLTFGHGRLSGDEIVALLRGADVDAVIDVRRFPGSRANPHVRRDALAVELPAAGIGYDWEPRLGGRRSVPPDSPDTWWQVPAFRAYAAHMRSADFLEGIDGVLAGSTDRRTAVMCSESVWWRCHRRLIADFAVLARGVPVSHLGHDGRVCEHPVAAAATVTADGLLVYAA